MTIARNQGKFVQLENVRMSLSTRIWLVAGLAAVAVPALAQNPAAVSQNDFERPYGFGYGEESTPYDAGTRDINGNRVIIDGRIVVGDDLSSLSTDGAFGYRYRSTGAAYGAGASTVTGNQLNVITQGSYNTVVIDSTQINNGDQNVILNGELNLND